MSETVKKKESVFENVLVIAIFVIVVFLPFADSLFHLNPSPPMVENRLLNPVPEAPGNLDEFFAYPDKFTAFYNDHFGMRSAFIRLRNFLFSFFPGGKVSNIVVAGKDGWLFGSDRIYYYRAELNLSEKEIATAVEHLARRQKWLNDRGIEYLIVLVPDKGHVYPEFLPGGINRVNEKTHVEQLIEAVQKDGRFDLLDLTPLFKEKKAELQLFQPSDVHWNEESALLGVNTIVERLKQKFPVIQQLPDSIFVRSSENRPGELAVLSGLEMKYVEEVPIVDVKEPHSVEVSEELYAGHAKGIVTMTTQRPRYPEVIVLHDSFGELARGYLAEVFNRSTFFWGGNFDKRFIAAYKPDVVISLMYGINFVKSLEKPFDHVNVSKTFKTGNEATFEVDGSINAVTFTIESREDVSDQNEVIITQDGDEITRVLFTNTATTYTVVVPSLPEKRRKVIAFRSVRPDGATNPAEFEISVKEYGLPLVSAE